MTQSSTSNWKHVDLPVIDHIRGSTEVRELAREHWPPWALGSTKFNRLFAFAQPATVGTTLPSTGIVAALLTERIDPKDAPKYLNHNLYLIAESGAGEYYQSGPIRPTDPPHHSSSPSTWFEGIGPPI